MSFHVKEYIALDGKNRFRGWLERLDVKIKARIQVAILKMEKGNLGDFKSLGEGVFELRLHYGAGYRVYYGKEGRQIILLLCGGDKATQVKDIKLAKELWIENLERISDGKKNS